MRWFIAIRYFLSHKRQSLVCIAGVTISVTMFLAMTSMMDGLTEKFIVETVESSRVRVAGKVQQADVRKVASNGLESDFGAEPRQ